MIDPGIDLDGYGGGEEPARRPRPAQPQPTFHPDGSATIPLADLQAAGFNHEPPHGSPPWQSDLVRMLLHSVYDEPVEPPACLKAKPPAPTMPAEPIFLGYRSVPVLPRGLGLDAWFEFDGDDADA